MKADGVDPVPIKKLTGEFGFCQTYFDDARIPLLAVSVQKARGGRWPCVRSFERGAIGGQAGALCDVLISTISSNLRAEACVTVVPRWRIPSHAMMMKLVLEAKGNQLMGAKSRIPALCEDWLTAIAMSGNQEDPNLRKMTRFALSPWGNGGSHR